MSQISQESTYVEVSFNKVAGLKVRVSLKLAIKFLAICLYSKLRSAFFGDCEEVLFKVNIC